MRTRTIGRRASVLAVVACAGTAGGVAYATIPGSSGTINGCYEKRTGILRVIDTDTGAKCMSFETAISWSQKGQKGPTGPAGAAGERGPTGLRGEAGAAGAPGPMGSKGDQGTAGARGPTGAKGDPGTAGARGPTGPKGDPGAEGAAGARGTTGLAGPTGPRGPAGLNGQDGAPGPTGPRGAQGDRGPTGAAGPRGADGEPGATGARGATGLTGPKGDRGLDGVGVSSRALAPGGSNCAYGGSSFTSISGTTFACNGAPGEPGPAGAGVFALGMVTASGLMQGARNVAYVAYDNDAKEWWVQLQTAATAACVPIVTPFGIGDRIATIGSGVADGFYVGIRSLTTRELVPGGFFFVVVCL